MTYIANPIYDSVFKFLMEDNRVAKILLSALLKKEVVELTMRPQEYSNVTKTNIALFRIDFSAQIRDKDGSKHLITIELQKTWLPTETLRFRQYLGMQYLNKENMDKPENTRYGVPLISIYILGHSLGDLKEAVIYVRRRYLDYEDTELSCRDPFIESLTHDSIIVQIPSLHGVARNHLERLLSVFDQTRQDPSSEHILRLDDVEFSTDFSLVVRRLEQAGVSPVIRRDMDIEDQFISELEGRDTLLMQKDQAIEKKDQVIEEKDQVIEEKVQVIEEKDKVIEEKDQALKEKNNLLIQKDRILCKMLFAQGFERTQIALELKIAEATVDDYLDEVFS